MEFKIIEAAKGIFVIRNGNGGWCKSNLVYFNGLLIDTGPDPVICSDNINALKKELDVKDLIIHTIVITHPDIDHVGGLKLFPEARVVIAKNAVTPFNNLKPALMSSLVKNSYLLFGSGKYYKKSMTGFDFAGIELRKPDEVFEDGMNLTIGGKDVKLKNFSYCHSHSDTIVMLPDDVIASGDLLFSGVTPIVWGYPGNWIKALDHIISMKPHVIIPGHGGIMSLEDVVKMKEYLEFVGTRTVSYKNKKYLLAKTVKSIASEMPEEYKSLLLPERLAVNVESFYAELDKKAGPADYPVMRKLGLFGKMKKAEGYYL